MGPASVRPLLHHRTPVRTTSLLREETGLEVECGDRRQETWLKPAPATGRPDQGGRLLKFPKHLPWWASILHMMECHYYSKFTLATPQIELLLRTPMQRICDAHVRAIALSPDGLGRPSYAGYSHSAQFLPVLTSTASGTQSSSASAISSTTSSVTSSSSSGRTSNTSSSWICNSIRARRFSRRRRS